MSRPRVLKLHEPKLPPKKKCVRGHVQRKVGWTLHRTFIKGKYYTVRRCRACLRADVKKCKKRSNRKHRPRRRRRAR